MTVALTALSLMFAVQAAPIDSDSARLGAALDSVEAIGATDCSAPGATCPTADSQYRLPLPTDSVERDPRLDALEYDGEVCAIDGAIICETKTRPILRAGELPADTLDSAIDPK